MFLDENRLLRTFLCLRPYTLPVTLRKDFKVFSYRLDVATPGRSGQSLFGPFLKFCNTLAISVFAAGFRTWLEILPTRVLRMHAPM